MQIVKGIYIVIRIVFFAWCWAMASFVVVFHTAPTFSPLLVVYDITLLSYFFVIPKYWEHRPEKKFDNVDEIYKFIGTIIFGCFGYYIMEHVYKL